jgi:hypothetical protein
MTKPPDLLSLPAAALDPDAPIHVLELLVASVHTTGLVLELVYDAGGILTATWHLGSWWRVVPEIGEA